MKVLIIEDELFSAERLQRQLKKIDSNIEVIDVITSVADALAWFEANPEPDLIFMDIHLEDQSSFEIFEESPIAAPLIYTTAYDQYALKAFKQNSIDYLLKPIVYEELEKAINKFKTRYGNANAKPQSKERFLVKKGSQYVSIADAQIAYFKSEQKVNFLITHDNEKYIVDQTLDQLSQSVDPKKFYRISRSRMVGIKSIDKIHSHFNGRLKLELRPAEEEEVFVSRERVVGFKSWLDE